MLLAIGFPAEPCTQGARCGDYMMRDERTMMLLRAALLSLADDFRRCRNGRHAVGRTLSIHYGTRLLSLMKARAKRRRVSPT